MMRIGFITLLFLVLASAADAAHECEDDSPHGTESKRELPFPRSWFKVGNLLLTDPQLHVALKEEYDGRYVSGVDEGEFGYLCLNGGTAFVSVTTNDWAVRAQYAGAAPACLSCAVSSGIPAQLSSASGLTLGQTKTEVASVIGAQIESDIVTVQFEALRTQSPRNVWHTETLELEFANEVLVRFSVAAYDELD